MPVLRQPKYFPQPVAWDELNGKGESLSTNLPISEIEERIGTDAENEKRGNDQTEKVDASKAVADLQTELQKARKEGYEAGYRDGFIAGQNEGYQQGIADAEQKFREQQIQQHQYTQHLLNKLAEAIRGELSAFFNRAEEAVTELALEIARKVVEVEVKTNPEVVRKAVAQAIEELKGGNITVRLNPEDFSLFGNDLSLMNLGEGVSVRFVPDESVERGGVVAESEQGFVDLQPQTKLALLQAEVL